MHDNAVVHDLEAVNGPWDWPNSQHWHPAGESCVQESGKRGGDLLKN